MTRISGIVHGRRIELDADSGLPDGFRVEVTLVGCPSEPATRYESSAAAAILESAGSWSDADPVELDRWLEETYRGRGSPERDIFMATDETP